MRFVRRFALILFILAIPAVASAAPPTEGRWALRAANRPFMLLELRKDPTAKGGWTGSLSRPKQFVGSSNMSMIEEVEGPAIGEQIISVIERADELELMVRDSSSQLDRLIWRPFEGGGGTLTWVGVPVPPLPFSPATANERVPDAWDKARIYSAMPDWPDNPDMRSIFEADQAARSNAKAIDWTVVGPQDEARRRETKALLDAGKLRSGTDFYHAAFVFQHGGSADSHLLAHTLAAIAAARGRPDATWIASATLDRYLQGIGQKQIYGTQFQMPKDMPATMEPYDRSLVSDALRSALGVPPIAAQEEQRKAFDAARAEGPSRP